MPVAAKLVEVPIGEYQEMAESYMGWCTQCKEFTRDSTEPDACGYDCPKCESLSVIGAEEALLAGEFVLT